MPTSTKAEPPRKIRRFTDCVHDPAAAWGEICRLRGALKAYVDIVAQLTKDSKKNKVREAKHG
jgi:hypothetical protein